MTLPVSPNSISFNQVNVELNRTGTLSLSLNDSIVRALFGVASGTISMSNGHGKSNVFVFTLASGYSIDLRNAAIAAGWNGTSRVQATTSGNIGAANTSSYALIVTGSFPNGVTLINNHSIVGAGGLGGRGHYVSAQGSENTGGTGYSGLSSTGGAGGPALNATVALTLQNNGTIAGGGGGGGGGYHGDYPFGGSGGGGGAGLPAGLGGRAQRYVTVTINNYGATQQNDTHNTAGSGGTLTAGGSGGPGGYIGGYGDNRYGNHGGVGGGLGSSGGGNVWVRQGTAAPGAGGAAIVGNGNITYTATGTRSGSIS